MNQISKTNPLPTLGACADRLYEIRDLKSKLNREIALLDEERKSLERHLVDTLPASDAEGVVGKTVTARVKRKEIPTVEDWGVFEAYVRQEGFYLMQRRVSEKAIKELWEDGKTVPGVGKFTVKVISLTKK